MYMLTDGMVAQMWAYDIDADQWSALGKPWGHLKDTEFVRKSDSLLYAYAFPHLPPDEYWPCEAYLQADPPLGALLGGVGQVVDSTTGLQMDIDYDLVNHHHYVSVDGESGASPSVPISMNGSYDRSMTATWKSILGKATIGIGSIESHRDAESERR